MLARQLTFPLSMLVVPLVWLLLRPPGAYPHGIDLLVTLPFVIDLAGNASNAFNSIEYFDDAVHAINPVLIVTAITVVSRRRGHSRWVAALIASGLGSTGHILFEIIEFQLFTGGNARLNLTLADTLSDLGWGIVGSCIGVVLGLASEPSSKRAAPVLPSSA